MKMERRFAFFDFDGTLIDGDSIVSLLPFAKGKGFPVHLGKGLEGGLAYKLGRCSDKEGKERALSFLKGLSPEETAPLAQAFCRERLLPRLREKGRAELQRLSREGYALWLVSASPDFYLEPLKQELPFERIIATRMEVDAAGLYTGKIDGENCRGIQKPLRLAEILSSLGQQVDYEHSRAYGDSAGDAPLLNLCGTKVCVNAKRGLRREMAKDPGAVFVKW